MFNRREIDELKRRLDKLEDRIPDVSKEGKPLFASKLVQTIVYSACGAILMAAVASFTGSVPWLG